MADGSEANAVVLTGGCQCGQVRYTAHATSVDAYYCHCGMCRRAFGNIFAAFVNLKKTSLTWHVEPKYYASSKIARRGFCGQCGTPLSFEYHDFDNVDLSVGSLDEPDKMRPVMHVGVESRLANFAVEDGLPVKRIDEFDKVVQKWKAAYGPDARPGQVD